MSDRVWAPTAQDLGWAMEHLGSDRRLMRFTLDTVRDCYANTDLHHWHYTEEILLQPSPWNDPETDRSFYSGITDQSLNQGGTSTAGVSGCSASVREVSAPRPSLAVGLLGPAEGQEATNEDPAVPLDRPDGPRRLSRPFQLSQWRADPPQELGCRYWRPRPLRQLQADGLSWQRATLRDQHGPDPLLTQRQ